MTPIEFKHFLNELIELFDYILNNLHDDILYGHDQDKINSEVLELWTTYRKLVKSLRHSQWAPTEKNITRKKEKKLSN